jgi:hypothetical protein
MNVLIARATTAPSPHLFGGEGWGGVSSYNFSL